MTLWFFLDKLIKNCRFFLGKLKNEKCFHIRQLIFDKETKCKHAIYAKPFFSFEIFENVLADSAPILAIFNRISTRFVTCIPLRYNMFHRATTDKWCLTEHVNSKRSKVLFP